MAAMSPLRQRMIEDMTIRNLSLATQQSYIYAIAKFSRHFGCSPDRLSLEQVRAYQLQRAILTCSPSFFDFRQHIPLFRQQNILWPCAERCPSLPSGVSPTHAGLGRRSTEGARPRKLAKSITRRVD